MTTRPIAILDNRLYVPIEHVTEAHKAQFTHNLEILDDLGLPQQVVTYKPSANGKYIGFARGDLGKLGAVFGSEFEIEDQRALVPFDFPLKFISTLREEQLQVIADWKKYGYGMIKCPPRFGKTVVLSSLLCDLKQQTLVLAHESNLLQQFEDELRVHTNINELEKEYGLKLVGQMENYDDVFPICTLSTWQLLNQPGAKQALKINKNAFGAVFVDEAHACAAPCFSKIVNNFNPYYRLPTTASDKRKDGAEIIVSQIAGPVTAIGSTEQLPVEVSVIWTQHNVKPFQTWNTLVSRLCQDDERNAFIAQHVVQDVLDGHSCVVFTDRRLHAKTLLDCIKKVDPDITVEIVIGGSPKTAIRDRARTGETQVVIASPKIVQLGWNVPIWSSLHNTLPMSNEPNWYQRISRIRTKAEKPQPVARIYADPGHPAIFACLKVMDRVHKKLNFNVKYVGSSKPVNAKKAKIKVTPRTGRGRSWVELD